MPFIMMSGMLGLKRFHGGKKEGKKNPLEASGKVCVHLIMHFKVAHEVA
jgi:hypothetical protein